MIFLLVIAITFCVMAIETVVIAFATWAVTMGGRIARKIYRHSVVLYDEIGDVL